MRILATLLALLVALSLAGITAVAQDQVCTCENCDCSMDPYYGERFIQFGIVTLK